MTNKDKIQAAHLEAIKDNTTVDWGNNQTKAATSCTTITAEAIGEYEKWRKGIYIDTDRCIVGAKWHDVKMLPQLFLNQKAKI